MDGKLRHVVVGTIDRGEKRGTVVIEWESLGEASYTDAVSALLHQMNSHARVDVSYAPDGSGGDRGIDYLTVTGDGKTTIFQLKYFPSKVHTTQLRQIRRSFATALQHEPELWVLIIPCRLTDATRSKVLDLATSTTRVQISDVDWLNAESSQRPELVDYVELTGDKRLIERAALLGPNNPIVRTAPDAARVFGTAQRRVDAADKHWTLVQGWFDGTPALQLQPKHPNAFRAQPITGIVTLTDEAAAKFEHLGKYGCLDPVSFSGVEVVNFAVSGSALVEYTGPVAELKLGPGDVRELAAVDLRADSSDGAVMATLQCAGRVTGGSDGLTLALEAPGLQLTFTAPVRTRESGRLDVRRTGFGGFPARQIADVVRMLDVLPRSAQLRVWIDGRPLFAAQSPAGIEALDGMDEYALFVSDLEAIENETGARFRTPAGGVTETERIMIRNTRLLLEGRVVMDPTTTGITCTITPFGQLDAQQRMHNTPMWFRYETGESGHVEILGQRVPMPRLAMLGLINQVDSQRIGDNLKVHARVRQGDRFRVYLPDKFDESQRLTVTPWGIPGVEQRGILEVPDGRTRPPTDTSKPALPATADG